MAIENIYSQHLTSDFYSACPKSVFAALALSIMANHIGRDVDVLEPELLQEWYKLHMRGIVPQCPPKRLWKLCFPEAQESKTMVDNLNS